VISAYALFFGGPAPGRARSRPTRSAEDLLAGIVMFTLASLLAGWPGRRNRDRGASIRGAPRQK